LQRTGGGRKIRKSKGETKKSQTKKAPEKSKGLFDTRRTKKKGPIAISQKKATNLRNKGIPRLIYTRKGGKETELVDGGGNSWSRT